MWSWERRRKELSCFSVRVMVCPKTRVLPGSAAGLAAAAGPGDFEKLTFVKVTGFVRFAEEARECWFPSPVVLDSGRLMSASEPPLASPTFGDALRSGTLVPAPFIIILSVDVVVSFDVVTPSANTFC